MGKSLLFTVVALLLTVIMAGAAEFKDVTFTFKNAGPVVFSHDLHLNKYNNNCKVCHSAIFNLRERRRFSMAEMEKTRSCGACHTGVKAFSVSNGKECVRCHKGAPKDVAYTIKGLGSTVFSHAGHIAKNGGSCKGCHSGMIKTNETVSMAQMEKGKKCGACHNGKRSFTVAGNCDRCHKGLKPGVIKFKTDAGEASFSHQFHLGIYKCADCHTKIFPYKSGKLKATMSDMEAGKSCGTCHNKGKDAFSVQEDCNKCHKM